MVAVITMAAGVQSYSSQAVSLIRGWVGMGGVRGLHHIRDGKQEDDGPGYVDFESRICAFFRLGRSDSRRGKGFSCTEPMLDFPSRRPRAPLFFRVEEWMGFSFGKIRFAMAEP